MQGPVNAWQKLLVVPQSLKQSKQLFWAAALDRRSSSTTSTLPALLKTLATSPKWCGGMPPKLDVQQTCAAASGHGSASSLHQVRVTAGHCVTGHCFTGHCFTICWSTNQPDAVHAQVAFDKVLAGALRSVIQQSWPEMLPGQEPVYSRGASQELHAQSLWMNEFCPDLVPQP